MKVDIAAAMWRGLADITDDGSEFLFCKDFDGYGIEITHHRTWAHHKLVSRG